MIDRRPQMFAQANQQHLVQARFNFSHKSRVRLDAIHNQYMISGQCVLIDMDGDPCCCLSHNGRGHGRSNLTPHCRRGDPIARENCELSFSGGTAMAPHGRYDEWDPVQALNEFDDSFNDDINARDPSAARCDRHCLAGSDLFFQVQSRKFTKDCLTKISFLRPLKLLFQPCHAWKLILRTSRWLAARILVIGQRMKIHSRGCVNAAIVEAR